MRIPLFPLRLVVFPEEKLNLHIFDPKYLNMISDCLEQGTTFGIPAFIDDTVMRVGTEMKVLEIVNEYDSGERDIKTVAVGLFEINEIQENKSKILYDVGQINPYFLINDQDERDAKMLIEKVNTLFSSLNVKNLEYGTLMKPITFSLGHILGLSLNLPKLDNIDMLHLFNVKLLHNQFHFFLNFRSLVIATLPDIMLEQAIQLLHRQLIITIKMVSLMYLNPSSGQVFISIYKI